MNLLTSKQFVTFRRVVALLLVMMFTSAASNQVTITFTANSPGATLVQKGKLWGKLPFPLTFNIPYADQQNGGVWIGGGYAEWPNGTRSNFDKFYLDLRQGNTFTYTIASPQNNAQARLEHQRRANSALEKCNAAIIDLSDFCPKQSPVYSNLSCYHAYRSAENNCYVEPLAPLRCKIARAHAKAICSRGRDQNTWARGGCSIVMDKVNRCLLNRR